MNADVTDAAYRLARLFDQPGALAVLGEGLRRSCITGCCRVSMGRPSGRWAP